jgi:hypothetical protein
MESGGHANAWLGQANANGRAAASHESRTPPGNINAGAEVIHENASDWLFFSEAQM